MQKLLAETPWILLCADELHGLDGLLKQESGRKYRVWYDAWETWSVPWSLKKQILWWAHYIPIVNFNYRYFPKVMKSQLFPTIKDAIYVMRDQ